MEVEDDDDAVVTSWSSPVVDLYCHEEPLVSTPPTTTHSSAGSSAADNGDQQPRAFGAARHVPDGGDESGLMAEYMARQRCYAPSRGYVDRLIALSSSPASSSLSVPDGAEGTDVSTARSRGVHYIIYAFGRLRLAPATAFNAVNYLDRFLSVNLHIQRWETWMGELVTLACLSVACKLDEVNIPSLHHLQMEEAMSHSFRPATIRDMELTLLKALQWRLACVTPLSFLQLLIASSTAPAAAETRCTRLLIRSLSEASLLRFDPSVIAASALRCVLLQDGHHQHADAVSSFLTRRTDQCPLADKDADDECFRTMKLLYARLDDWSNNQHLLCISSSSDQQQGSPVPVFPPSGTDSTVHNRSTVSRCLFGRPTLEVISTEDEDNLTSDNTQGVNQVATHI